MLTTLTDHETEAARVLPAAVYDAFASGSGDEQTLHEATSSWARYRLRPRVLRDVGSVDLATEVLGLRLGSPVAVAPAGYMGLAHDEGELAVARGARVAGSLYVMSTRASHPIEEIAAETDGPWWFQVYAMRDRDLTLRLADRAATTGARALVLTGDTPYVGIKRRIGSNRGSVPDDQFLVNMRPHLGDAADARQRAEQDPTVTFDMIDRLVTATGLPVLVKGVLRGDEAVRCLDAGASGVIVSNHGGRQLDRAVPAATALPGVVEAVAGRGPVLVDGGIRSGLDCLVALAAGASAVLVGRPVVWGLAADGEKGVVDALGALRDDLAHAMALAGASSLADLDTSLLTGGAS